MKKAPKFIKYVINNGERGKVKNCQVCGQAFAFNLKEHQCKRCKRAVCDKCSPHKALTIIDGVPQKQPHRQCNVCKDECEKLKQFIQQYKIVFMEDSFSKEWLKAFGTAIDQANFDYDQSQRDEAIEKSKEEVQKMKSELPQVFQEIVFFKNYSLTEFFYLVVKDFNTTLILDSISRVLGTFLKIYPEVGYSPDQIFITFFLLCFCSEPSAYASLVYLYSNIIPQYTYPQTLKIEKYEFFPEIDKTMSVLTQAFKMSSQDSPYVKTFLRYRLARYIQTLSLNFFLFETSFFIINQTFLEPKQSYDDLMKYLACAYCQNISIFKQQQYDDIELQLLRNVRSAKVQDGFYFTKSVDFSRVITPNMKTSSIVGRQASILNDNENLKQAGEILQLKMEIDKLNQVITEQHHKIEKQKLEIENLEIKLQQTQQLINVYKYQGVPDLESYISMQDEELQNLRRATQSQKQHSFDIVEKQQMQAYIKKLESQVFIEYKANVQLKEQIEQLQLTKSQTSTAASQDAYEMEILEKNFQKYKRKYEKLKEKQKNQQSNSKGNKDQVTWEAKLQAKDKTISELELALNKNKFDSTAKILELESSLEQLEKLNKQLKKQISDSDNLKYTSQSLESNIVSSLQKRILEIQSECNIQLRQQQEKQNQQNAQLQQQLQKEKQSKQMAEAQIQELQLKINIIQKQEELNLQQKQNITKQIEQSPINNFNPQELYEQKQKYNQLQEKYDQLKNKHYQHLQMMISVEKDKLVNPEIQIALINNQEKEIINLQEKLQKKKQKLKQYKQKEKAWMRVNSDSSSKANQISDLKGVGETISRIIILLNLDGKIQTNQISESTIEELLQYINKAIEIQTTFSDEFSNVFEDGQYVSKLNELVDQIEDSFVLDVNSLRQLVDKINSVFSRIGSTKQKILQIFKQTFDQSDFNPNQNLDILILYLQQKLQKIQIEKEELESKISQLQLSKNKYLEVLDDSKREKKMLQGIRDLIIDLPSYSPSEVFTFSEAKFKSKQVDQEDAKIVLEVRNQQINTLKMILTEKQNQLETLNNGMIKVKDLLSNYFVQLMK